MRLYCTPCGNERGWPTRYVSAARGNCEICGTDGIQHDWKSPPMTINKEQAVSDAMGWLVEEDAGGIIHWIALATDQWPRTKPVNVGRRGAETDRYLSPIVRVKDANEALRFARKEDAEAFIRLFDRFLLCPVATEHAWPAHPLEQQQAVSGDVVERQDFSRITMRHNIETILRKYRDIHPDSLLDKIMATIPRAALTASGMERMREALNRAQSDLAYIERMPTHGMNDQSYINAMRANIGEAMQRVRTALQEGPLDASRDHE